MAIIKIFQYKYQVSCENDTLAEYYCNTYEEAHDLFCELIGQGYTPYLTKNNKFDAELDSRLKTIAYLNATNNRK